MTFKAILAMDEKRGLGLGFGIPWRIKEDFIHFKKTTLDQNLIMGRVTWENLPVKFLKNRTIYVLTNKNTFGWQHAVNNDDKSVVNIVEDLNKLPDLVYWIAGGAKIYDLFKGRISEYIVSHIKGEHTCDAFMPEFESGFKGVETILTHEKFEVKRYFN